MKIILLFIYIYCINGYGSVSTKGKCVRLQSNGLLPEWHCCDNKEDIKGICVDCLEGFLSESGESCHPCPEGTYGQKCADTCHCEAYQRCDNIQGCLNYSGYGGVSTMSSDSNTKWINSRTTAESGILRTELIYVICTGILTLTVIICMLWLRHLIQKRRNRDTQVVSYGNKELKTKDQNLEDNTHPKKLRVYEYIDESQIRDIVNPILKSLETAKTKNQNSSESEFDSDDSDDATTPLNDGYLNPYQPVVSSPDIQGYSSPANSSNYELQRHLDIPSTVVLGIDNTTTSQKIEPSSYNSYNDAMSAQPNMNQQLS